MANPTKLKWVGPTTYTDGSSFGEADLAGFQITVDGNPAVNVPMAYTATNAYEFDIADLSLAYGTHTVTVATVARNGGVSVQSNPATIVLVDERVPNPPTSLQAV